MSVIPEVSGMSQVIMQPETQVAVPIVSNPLINNDIRLSVNQKLRIDHNGIIKTESEFSGERVYTAVTCTEALALEYGLADSYIGETINISVDREATPFPLSSSSTDDTDLVPANAAMADDQNDFTTNFYTDLPGKMGGAPMTDRNYLTMSSEQIRGLEVPGDIEDETSSSS